MSTRHSRILLALVLAGCGAEPPAPGASSGRPVVYGDDSRQEYYAHPDPVLQARALESTVALIRPGRIDTSDPNNYVIDHRTLGVDEDLCPGEPFADQQVGASCSGTLVGWDLVMTAGHCVDDFADCQGLWFVFDHLYEGPGQLASIGPEDVFQCRRLVARRDFRGIDYAFVQLDRPVAPPRRPAPVDLVDVPRVLGSSVAVVGFPDGIPAKLDSEGVVLQDGAPEYEEFEATVDTFGGNSGSGVYDADRAVIGILSRGETDYVRQGNCFVINRLPESGDQGDAEGIVYVGRALDGLCATGWRGALCGDPAGVCQACATDEVCPADHVCRAAAGAPAVTWCAAACATDAECPADYHCAGGACDPDLGTTCLGRAVYNRDVCGRIVDEVQTCLGPVEVCRDGACRAADPGNGCSDAQEVAVIDQVLTGSIGPGLSDEYQGSCGGEGAERVFSFELFAQTQLEATAQGFDTVLHLRSSCNFGATEVACNDDDEAVGERGSRISLTLEPGRYFIFMDSYGGRTGDYRLDLDFTDLAPPDAGLPPDTGVEPDAGFAPDAEPAPIDAGVVVPDAGGSPADAGAGLDKEGEGGGCGCTNHESGSAPWTIVLVVFGLLVRRRLAVC